MLPLPLKGNIGAIQGRILDVHWPAETEHEKIRDPFIQSSNGLMPFETSTTDPTGLQLARIAQVVTGYASLLPVW